MTTKSNKYIIAKGGEENEVEAVVKPDSTDKKLCDINCKKMGMIVGIIVVVVIIIITIWLTSGSEGFANNNILEQQMFQEMTEENKQIYLELTDEGKQNIFTTWKKNKNL